MKKVLLLVGLSMIVVLVFASAASATCVASSSASGGASASECNDVITSGFISGSGTVSASLPSDTAALPGSGGFSPALALVTLALLVGSGLLAFNIVLRR